MKPITVKELAQRLLAFEDAQDKGVMNIGTTANGEEFFFELDDEHILGIQKQYLECELCKKKVTVENMAWNGSFVLCKKCEAYLKRKGK